MMKDLIIQQQQQQQQVHLDENMSNLTSASGEASGSSGTRNEDANGGLLYPQQYYLSAPPPSQTQPPKKKRNLPGNPDPESEVIALSPKTLMATNRFVCEVCKKGFQRDQNLQLHRRGHNLPWKLKQRNSKEVIRRKVYVCPEASCVHHDPSRALGDLTGIKKHFCRKHGEKKWKCEKCSKRYAVQSDWKAHSKTCGTREYRCDCGTLFSRRDSFITHRAFCDALAEESARATITQNTNPIFQTQPITAHHHINNFQIQNQFHHPFAALKKEPQTTFGLMNQEFPPQWLTNCPQQVLGLNQEFENHERGNPNPSNNNILGANLPPPHPYHPTSSPASLYTSATALLQKAAQIGATMSSKQACASAPAMGGTHQGNHMSTDDSNVGLHLSSREEFSCEGFVNNLASYGNKAAESTAAIAAGTPPPPTSLPQEDMMMMMNSLSSSSFDGSAFEDAFGAGFFLNNNNTKKYHQGNLHDGGRGGGGGGGNDAMTRDFLGLRPMSHNEIFSIAGFGNCMNNNSSSTSDQQSGNQQKQWQG